MTLTWHRDILARDLVSFYAGLVIKDHWLLCAPGPRVVHITPKNAMIAALTYPGFTK
jgi:hypothetical protein